MDRWLKMFFDENESWCARVKDISAKLTTLNGPNALPFGALWYAGPNAISNAIGFAKHRSRSHRAVIRPYDESGNVIETHEHKGDFKES